MIVPSFLLLFTSMPGSTGALTEDWQTVFPDTQQVIKLFGPEGPKWQASYSQENDGPKKKDRHSLSAEVPGDIVTDLMRAGWIGDPYMDRNFVTERSVWMGPTPTLETTTNISTSSYVLQEQNGGKHHTWPNEPHLERRTRTWVYSCEFVLPPLEPSAENTQLVLVVEGIKMGATLALNGLVLGNVTDQFLRYEFSLNDALSQTTTKTMTTQRKLQGLRTCNLTITFHPDITTQGRFQACSGGWDWAPYTRTGDERGSRTFTFGIWKPLYIIQQKHLSITHVVPKIFYLGDSVQDYPRSPMLNGSKYDFRVDVDVHVSGTDPQGFILLRANFTNVTTSAKVDSHIVTLSILAPKEGIKLWWPSSTRQPLYTLQVSYQSDDGFQTRWISKTIGFRTLDLITFNDTDPETVQESIHQEGSGNHGMFFRVNGAVTWARGANVVPMDQLEGRLTEDAHRIMVYSAAEAGMNMIRVWGGGMVMPQRFYDACDEMGILVYHDMMLVEESNHGAKEIPELELEIRHLVRSLSSHPSIALWSGCNECIVEMDSAMAVYATFVMQAVAQEDPTRPLWPSCPSTTGWKSGVARISGKPDGGPLTTYSRKEAKPPHTIEKHGPYRHGISRTHPSMNWNDDRGAFGSNLPPDLNLPFGVGPEYLNSFISEFGISSWSSFESVSATLSPAEWSMHGSGTPDTCVHVKGTNYNDCRGRNVLAERNYACDSEVEAYFGATDFDATGEDAFKAQLHKCVMATTLWLKGQVEIFRGSNSFGTLIWQLNENWPTGGWGLLEYGSSHGQKGQSIGGRWKPVMHLLKQALFQDVFATCGQRGECYIRNDSSESLSLVSIQLEIYDLASGEQTRESIVTLPLLLGNGHVEYFHCPWLISASTEVLVVSIQDQSAKNRMCDHVVLWTEPMNLVTEAATVVIDIVTVEHAQDGSMRVALVSNLLALHVVLTSPFEGRFSENSFLLRKNERKTVSFVSDSNNNTRLDPEAFRRALRVEHLLSYV